MYTALDHHLQRGLMDQHEFDRTPHIVQKLSYYHVDAGHVHKGYNYKIVVRLRVYTFIFEMMSRLIAKGIIRRYGMRRR